MKIPVIFHQLRVYRLPFFLRKQLPLRTQIIVVSILRQGRIKGSFCGIPAFFRIGTFGVG